MKKRHLLFAGGIAALTALLSLSCGPATHVSVGVGVAYPGPWVGPYGPGGVVVVGRPYPYPGPYLPLRKSEQIELVKKEASQEKTSHGL